MSIVEILKFEATALQTKAQTAGNPIKHTAALELVAKNYGFKSWRALRGTFLTASSGSSGSKGKSLEMKRYSNSEWRFGLDVPERWNAFPAVPTNSPYEVIRFASHEDGEHLAIIFRGPFDPKITMKAYSERIQASLAKAGFGNFAFGLTGIGTLIVPTLDFDKPRDAGLWSCRHYFVIAGTLSYTLGFGTNRRSGMIETFDRMAKSFAFEEAKS